MGQGAGQIGVERDLTKERYLTVSGRAQLWLYQNQEGNSGYIGTKK